LAGEIAVRQMLRAALHRARGVALWAGRHQFPAKIVEAANRLGALRVVSDEFGNPTYAPDVAAAIVQLIESGRYGIYHLVNEGHGPAAISFAQQVLAASGRGHIEVTPISHKEWQRTAPPPLHAVLVNQAAAALGIRLRPWEAAVAEYCRQEFAAVA
jgi:dTDP-4-dehydrorhamnose reductase